jgi:hypothetical protein
MSVKIEIPKKKPNYFNVYDKHEKKYNEVKFLTQQEIAEGWLQVLPQYADKNLINHFSVTLAFLPEIYWSNIKKGYKNGEEIYKVIKDGITRYTIIETNQDETMKKLFVEVKKMYPNYKLLQEFIDELDVSQHTSWLVLRAKHIIEHRVPYFSNKVEEFQEIKNIQALLG